MVNAVPFLSLDERIDYLDRKDYFPRGSFTETDRARLDSMNFHYFLGYARNFRQLYFQERMKGDKSPSEVFAIIDIDAAVSTLVYSGIRNAEWLLRHYVVQHYCQKFDPRGRFLDPGTYLDLGGEYTNEFLVHGLINDVLEYSESYVVNQLDEKSKAMGWEVPNRCVDGNRGRCRELLEDLSLWSVVDSFSLGRLVKFIERCDNSDEAESHLWRDVAADMDIPGNRFLAGMDSLRALRNLVSHQSRLWMRPTTNTVSKKGQFRKKVDRCHRKAMLVAFYNVASFQGAEVQRFEFASSLEAIMDGHPNYIFGVSEFGKATAE